MLIQAFALAMDSNKLKLDSRTQLIHSLSQLIGKEQSALLDISYMQVKPSQGEHGDLLQNSSIKSQWIFLPIFTKQVPFPGVILMVMSWCSYRWCCLCSVCRRATEERME